MRQTNSLDSTVPACLQRRVAICMSKSLAKQKAWQQLLGLESRVNYPATVAQNSSAFVVDWGNKRQHQAAQYASRYGVPILRLEDGFVRSLGLGVQGSQAFSLVMDDVGIYYDTRAPSRLENTLNALPNSGGVLVDKRSQDKKFDESYLIRARRCIDLIVANGISKYNNLAAYDLGLKKRYRVLVVDQAVGDLSITGAGASSQTFLTMLDTAIHAHPSAEILVKIHPDALLSKKQSHFNITQLKAQGVRLIDTAVSSLSILKQVDEVYVVSSQMGFEALLCGKRVTCFAQPFYAGWGLTQDMKPFAPHRRKFKKTLEEVFAAAYFDYSVYFHPISKQPCDLETVLEFVALQRQMYERNAGRTVCIGLPPWKRAYVAAYLYSPWGKVKFYKCINKALNPSQKIDRVVLWGNICSSDLRAGLARRDIELMQVEDGFIRSVGLGKYYIPPLSLVFDRKGIYYDPHSVSDLENILQKTVFSQLECERAAKLVEKIIAEKVSKYNVGSQLLPASVLEAKKDRREILLVPGQVENDASIIAACSTINNDKNLLAVVRENNPDAFILYKPHPDIVSGNVVNGLSNDSWARNADAVVTEAGIDDCLAVADEVHTMTSLAGFEALIRGLKVVTYGKPFYAGWGLTRDMLAVERRSRTLTLPELAAAVLIRYPRYFNYSLACFVSPEQALANLIGQKRELRLAIRANKVFRFLHKCKNFMLSHWYGFYSGAKRIR